MCFLSQFLSIGVELACFWSNFPFLQIHPHPRLPAGHLQRTRFHPKVGINIWLYIIYMQNRYIRSIKHTSYVCPSINFNDILLPFAPFRNILLRASLLWWSSTARCGPAELHYHRYYRRHRRDRPTDRPKFEFNTSENVNIRQTVRNWIQLTGHLWRWRWKRGSPF